jgi:hypothetical protein
LAIINTVFGFGFFVLGFFILVPKLRLAKKILDGDQTNALTGLPKRSLGQICVPKCNLGTR